MRCGCAGRVFELSKELPMPIVTRRHLLSAAAAGTAMLLPWSRARGTGNWRSLRATRRVIDVNGKAADVFGLLQPDGMHGIAATAGDRFHLQLVNELDEHTLVHWHGLTPPSGQDGVPDLSQPTLKAGRSYAYDFLLARPGTNWMHSHVGLQEQRLLAAPLIVRDPAEAHLDEQEVVVLLHDFTFRDPAEVFSELTGGTEAADHGEAMHADGMDHTGLAAAEAPPHLNDVEFDAYLANDRTLADPEVVRVEAGGRVRLRIINGAAATNFWLDLGTLSGDLIAVDGHPVMPVSGSRFPLAIAQRLDIRLQLPAGAGSYPILAVREGDTPRTGIVLATSGAEIARIPDRAKIPAGAVDPGLERLLLAAGDPLAATSEKRPLRSHTLELTGSMMGFVWGFNGRRFGEATPLPVRQGERVEIRLANRTDMSHPVHLHGHPFQVAAIDDVVRNGALRDTVLVPIGGSVTIAFNADNPGHWALHCHNLYHMAAGMMTSVKYEA
jgi:FtsP/CotA-like multicopper oxidase with cupredoxin domain